MTERTSSQGDPYYRVIVSKRIKLSNLGMVFRASADVDGIADEHHVYFQGWGESL